MTISAIRDAIYNRLNDTSITSQLATPASGRTTAIYHEQAPADAKPPYVIFDKQSGMPANRAMMGAEDQNDIWLVKGVSRKDAVKAESIADAIFARLNNAPVAVPGYTTLWLRRETDVDYWESVEGDRWDHTGYQFRFVGEPT